MGLNTNTEGTVEAQASWNVIAKGNGLLDLNLPEEYMEVVQAYYKLAFDKGSLHAIDNMREIYENDVDLFEDFFDVDREDEY